MAVRRRVAKNGSQKAKEVQRTTTDNRPNIADARRILPTTDVFAEKLEKNQVDAFLASRRLAVTHFYEGLKTLRDHYDVLVGGLQPGQVALPTQISGILLEPDSTPARLVSVTAGLPVVAGQVQYPNPVAVTDDQGVFHLRIPANILLPAGSSLALEFKGANGSETQNFPLVKLGDSGLVGNVQLHQNLAALPQSIVGSLRSLLGGLAPAPSPGGQTGSIAPPVTVKLGTDDCPITFSYNLSEERFPYSVLIRLVEPRTSIQTEVLKVDNGTGHLMLAFRNPSWKNIFTNPVPSFADRVPVDQPISVDGFRDKIVGVVGDTIGVEETVPMAGTLGLGYVVRLAQQWTPAGLSLGDLVYSLPLAPGEQQRIAVFEQRQTLSTTEIESLDEEEQQRQTQQADSSNQATFDSAFNESLRGSSSYATHADSSSWGAAGGIGLAIGPLVIGGGAAGGGGSASTSGNAQQSLDGARNYTSHAAQVMHSASERQAGARRRAQRTSIRLASATDTEKVTTKIITNNNRAHALTVQYWEVLRHFDITTAVEGVSLVCFVPLEIVRFLPAGQNVNLDPAKVNTRAAILQRYSQLLKHTDILRPWLPRAFREGLALLEEFAGNPNAIPKLSPYAEDVVHVDLTGSLLPLETLYVTLVTRRGTRLGPMRMSPTAPIAPLPDRLDDPSHAFTTEADLLKSLRDRRANDNVLMQAEFALPASIATNDVIGFELTRSFRQLTYQLAPKKDDAANVLVNQLAQGAQLGLGPFFPLLQRPVQVLLAGVNLSPSQLESELGGPMISKFNAWTISMQGNTPTKGETYAADYIGTPEEMPPDVFPVPALQVKPLLKFNDLLKIEQTLQHVVRNTITYSKAVWMSLTPEERAIMLEGYTIGVPSGGIVDDTQHIPLLNCVANQVLGFFGNAYIMPFTLPPVLAERIGGDSARAPLTTGQIQDALTNFHRNAFSPPVSHIALPTHGVLGEAVLGHCPSAEKIDLTRFWNWQDSPIPQASDLSNLPFGRTNLLTGAQAPNTLAASPSIINNNVGGAPASAGDGADILKSLIGSAGDTAKELPDITGSQKLADLLGKTLETAESARKDALAQAQSMATKALDKLPDVLKAQAEGKAAEQKQSEQDKTANDANVKSAFESLKGHAASFLAVANAAKDQPSADAFAKQVIENLAGKDGLPSSWAALLYESFHVTGSGGTLTQGSKAFLAALGLPLT